MPDGGLRVTDFKTGNESSLTDPLDGGTPAAATALRPRRRSRSSPASSTPTPPTRLRPRPAICYVREAKATSKPVPLDPALIAEFETYVARWLAEIADGRFVATTASTQRTTA